MATNSEQEVDVVSVLTKKIIELEKREHINVTMRIDELIAFLKFVLDLIDGGYEVVSISIIEEPYKTTYNSGEYFDPSGMVVQGVLENGNTIDVSDYTYSPSGELSTEDTYVTIYYQQLSTTLSITVNSLGNYVTYDGVHKVAYGENAENLIEY